MKAEEPCIGCPDISMDGYGYLCDLACGKRTTWLNYKAGRKEVVEWIATNRIVSSYWRWEDDEEWQAQLKKWGISQERGD